MTNKFAVHGGYKNFHEDPGEVRTIEVPARWRSAPGHPESFPAFITLEESELLRKANLHGYKDPSLIGTGKGPGGLPSYNGYGEQAGGVGGGGLSGAGDYGGGYDTGGNRGAYDPSTGGFTDTGAKGGSSDAEQKAKAKAFADKTKADYVDRMNRLNGFFGTQLNYDPETGDWSTTEFSGRVGDFMGGMIPGFTVTSKTPRGKDFAKGETKTDIDFGAGKFFGDIAGGIFGGPLGSSIGGKIGQELDKSIGTVDVDRSWDTTSLATSQPSKDIAMTLNPRTGSGEGVTALRTGLNPRSTPAPVQAAKDFTPAGLLTAESMARLKSGNQPMGVSPAMNRYEFDPEQGRIVRA